MDPIVAPEAPNQQETSEKRIHNHRFQDLSGIYIDTPVAGDLWGYDGSRWTQVKTVPASQITGLIGTLISVDPFTAAASVIIDSRSIGGGNLFQSDYENYLIEVRVTSMSGSTPVSFYLRMRSGGADQAPTNHYSNLVVTNNSTTVIGCAARNAAADGYVAGQQGATGVSAAWEVILWGPNLTNSAKPYSSRYVGSASVSAGGFCNGQASSATQMTGIKFLPDSQNLTGTAWTYGLRKAA